MVENLLVSLDCFGGAIGAAITARVSRQINDNGVAPDYF